MIDSTQTTQSKRGVVLTHFGPLQSVLAILPILETLIHQLPDLSITVLTTPIAADLLAGHPAIDQVIAIRRTKGFQWAQILYALKKRKGPRFVLYLQAETSWLGLVLSWAYSIPICIAPRSSWWSFWATHHFTSQTQALKLDWNRVANMLQPLGYRVHSFNGKVPAYPTVELFIAQELRRMSPQSKFTILVYLDADDPVDYCQRALPNAVRQWQKNAGCFVVFCAPPGYQNDWLSEFSTQQSACFIGTVGIRGVVALMRQSNMVVTASSAITRLASILNKPLLVQAPHPGFWVTRYGPSSTLFEVNAYHEAGSDVSFYKKGCDLMDAIATNNHLSESGQQIKREKAAFLILYWVLPHESSAQLQEMKDRFHAAGVTIELETLPSIFQLSAALKRAQKRGVTVIQCGQFPLGYGGLCRLKLSNPTAIVEIPLQPYISVSDYLAVYGQYFQS